MGGAQRLKLTNWKPVQGIDHYANEKINFVYQMKFPYQFCPITEKDKRL